MHLHNNTGLFINLPNTKMSYLFSWFSNPTEKEAHQTIANWISELNLAQVIAEGAWKKKITIPNDVEKAIKAHPSIVTDEEKWKEMCKEIKSKIPGAEKRCANSATWGNYGDELRKIIQLQLKIQSKFKYTTALAGRLK